MCDKCGFGSEFGTMIRKGKDKYVHVECPRDFFEFKYLMTLMGKTDDKDLPTESGDDS